jgi:DNA-binding NarL/FixJ family response regulator
LQRWDEVPAQKIRVVLVNHNPLLREGLSVLIRLQTDMEVLAAAATAAVQLYRELRPDMTLIDLDLPNGAGIQAIIQIRKLHPSAAILGLVTDDWDDSAKKSAMRAGVRGCLAKARLNTELIPRIREHCSA